MRKRPFKIDLPEEESIAIVHSSESEELSPRFNIAPTQNSIILKRSNSDDTLEACSMRWGLVPSWSKTAQTISPLVNARSETISEKPAFKAAFQRRRCLVPADGFYEWKKSRGANVPHFFHLKDDSIFYMAGIWETWFGELRETLQSFTILTTKPNTLVAKYHDRMPVILRGNAIKKWLDQDSKRLDANARLELFTPIDSRHMACKPANPAVSSNTTEGPSCLEAPEREPVAQLDFEL